MFKISDTPWACPDVVGVNIFPCRCLLYTCLRVCCSSFSSCRASLLMSQHSSRGKLRGAGHEGLRSPESFSDRIVLIGGVSKSRSLSTNKQDLGLKRSAILTDRAKFRVQSQIQDVIVGGIVVKKSDFHNELNPGQLIRRARIRPMDIPYTPPSIDIVGQ